jgi:hypothetical protein
MAFTQGIILAHIDSFFNRRKVIYEQFMNSVRHHEQNMNKFHFFVHILFTVPDTIDIFFLLLYIKVVNATKLY